jgi:hypothetical protein
VLASRRLGYRLAFLNFGSGNEIYTVCFSLSRLDFLGSFDPILIRFDRSGGCAGGLVCDEPDFRLTDDNMRRVCWTDGAHVPPLLELLNLAGILFTAS